MNGRLNLTEPFLVDPEESYIMNLHYPYRVGMVNSFWSIEFSKTCIVYLTKIILACLRGTSACIHHLEETAARSFDRSLTFSIIPTHMERWAKNKNFDNLRG